MVDTKVCGEEKLKIRTVNSDGTRAEARYTNELTKIVVAVDGYIDAEIVEDGHHVQTFRYRTHCGVVVFIYAGHYLE